MYLLGVDLGTSTAKAGILDSRGNLRRLAKDSYSSPAEGVETDPLKWLRAGTEVIRSAVGRDGLNAAGLAGISVGGQGPTVVPLDEEMRPVHPALLWNETQAVSQANRLSSILGRRVSPAWVVPKVLWLKENKPEVFSKARWFLQPMDYLVYQLTGEVVSACASDQIVPWRREEIEAGGLNSALFPPLLTMGTEIGSVTKEASLATGIPRGVPVFSGAPDFVEAILGTGAVEKGLVCDKAGTVDGVELCWDKEIKDPDFYSAPHPVSPSLWHLGGTALKTGLSFQWLGDILGERPKALEVLAKASPPLARGLLYLPSLPGALQGGFLGLSLQQRLGDLARAIMEGGAISVSAVVQAFRRLGAEPYEIRVTGGQSQSPLWNQIKADVTGLPVIATEISEGEVLGAAMIAAWGAGFYPNLLDASQNMVRMGERFIPRVELFEAYQGLLRDCDAVSSSLDMTEA